VGGALPRLYASGRLAPGSLPLMEHLHEIIALEREVAMPFARFFGEPIAP